jgi:TonB family protein
MDPAALGLAPSADPGEGPPSSRFAQQERRVGAIDRTSSGQGAQGGGEVDFSSVVKRREYQAALKACYERVLKRDEAVKAGGRVSISVEVGTSGGVTGVSVDAPAGFGAVSDCIKDTVRRWRFPASSEEYGGEFSLVLTPAT